MQTSKFFSSRWVVAAALMGSVVAGLSSVAAADQIVGRQRPTTATPSTYSINQARFIAERLYQGVLGRQADPSGLTAAARQIQTAGLARQIDAMVTSQEFQNGTARKSSADVLEQFYQGIHRRSPDPTGVALFMPRLDRRAYAGVLLEMLESSEFAETLAREVEAAPATRPVSADAAMACQARVLDAVTDAAAGRVLLAFEQLPETAQGDRVIRGHGVDRSEAARPFSYECDGERATFAYNDRRAANGADPRASVSSPVLRSCLTAAEEPLRNARVVAAATIANEGPVTHVFLTGYARGGAVQLTCTMNGQRVQSVRGR